MERFRNPAPIAVRSFWYISQARKIALNLWTFFLINWNIIAEKLKPWLHFFEVIFVCVEQKEDVCFDAFGARALLAWWMFVFSLQLKQSLWIPAGLGGLYSPFLDIDAIWCSHLCICKACFSPLLGSFKQSICCRFSAEITVELAQISGLLGFFFPLLIRRHQNRLYLLCVKLLYIFLWGFSMKHVSAVYITANIYNSIQSVGFP